MFLCRLAYISEPVWSSPAPEKMLRELKGILAAGMAKLMQALPAAAGATWPAWPVAGTGDVAQGDTERAAQGAASAGAAPDDGGERFDELISRLDAIEKRLDALEQKPRTSRPINHPMIIGKREWHNQARNKFFPIPDRFHFSFRYTKNSDFR